MRWQVATQLHAGIVAARVHRAEPAVPDGQPDRSSARSRSGSSRSDARTFRFALHHTGTDAELDALREGRREDRPPGGRDLRRVSGVRAGSLHVPRRLPAVRERRRHGAPQQHGDDRDGVDCGGRDAICSTRSRTSSSTAGTSSASGRRALEPFDFDRANMSGELWLAEGFTQYYGPLALQRARPGGRRVDRAHLRRPGRGGRRAPAGSCDRPRR